MTKNKAGQGLPGLLLFSVLKVVQGGRIRTMVIAHSLEQSPLPECCVLSGTYLCIGTFDRGGVIGFPILFLAMIDQVKTIKLRSIKHLNGISKAHKIICQIFYLQNSPQNV